MNRSRKLVALLTILVPLTVSACGGSSSANSGGTVTIGAIVPLSGPAAAIGQAFKKGIELGVAEVNSKGGISVHGQKKSLKIRFEDDESTPAGGQRATQSLLAENVQLFLGPAISSSFDTVYGSIKDDHTRLVLTPALASAKYLDGSDHLFKTQASQDGAAIEAYVAQLVKTYRPHRVAILNTGDPTGDAFVQGQVAAFKKLGVDVVYKNQVATDTTDYTPIISAMRTAKPDLVMTPYLDTVSAPLLKQAAQVGFVQPVFATDAGSRGQVAGVEDKIRTFVWRVTTRSPDNPNDVTVKAYRQKFQAKYGHEPTSIDFYNLAFYDPVQMLAEAIKAANTTTDVAAIGKELKKVRSWPDRVLTDEYFAGNGLAHYTQQVGTVSKGKPTFHDLAIPGN